MEASKNIVAVGSFDKMHQALYDIASGCPPETFEEHVIFVEIARKKAAEALSYADEHKQKKVGGLTMPPKEMTHSIYPTPESTEPEIDPVLDGATISPSLDRLATLIIRTKKGKSFTGSSLHRIREHIRDLKDAQLNFRQELADFVFYVLLTVEEQQRMIDWVQRLTTLSYGRLQQIPSIARPVDPCGHDADFEPELKGLFQDASAINALVREYQREIIYRTLRRSLGRE